MPIPIPFPVPQMVQQPQQQLQPVINEPREIIRENEPGLRIAEGIVNAAGQALGMYAAERARQPVQVRAPGMIGERIPLRNEVPVVPAPPIAPPIAAPVAPPVAPAGLPRVPADLAIDRRQTFARPRILPINPPPVPGFGPAANFRGPQQFPPYAAPDQGFGPVLNFRRPEEGAQRNLPERRLFGPRAIFRGNARDELKSFARIVDNEKPAEELPSGQFIFAPPDVERPAMLGNARPTRPPPGRPGFFTPDKPRSMPIPSVERPNVFRQGGRDFFTEAFDDPEMKEGELLQVGKQIAKPRALNTPPPGIIPKSRQQEEVLVDQVKKLRGAEILSSALKQVKANARKNRPLDYNVSDEEMRELDKLQDLGALERKDPTAYQRILKDPKVQRDMKKFSFAIKLKGAQLEPEKYTNRLGLLGNPFVDNNIN
jgi:hypothetical protein